MARRPASRWLAPLAIVVVGGAAYGILGSAGRRGSESPAAPARRSGSAPATRPATALPTTTQATARRTYTVRSGDTLSSIALDTGVPVSRLQQLNPTIDVQALQPGQRLKLRS
jgi:LysM repeat protein